MHDTMAFTPLKQAIKTPDTKPTTSNQDEISTAASKHNPNSTPPAKGQRLFSIALSFLSATPLKPAIKTPDMDMRTSTPDTTTPEAKRLEFSTDTPSSSQFDMGCNHDDDGDLVNLFEDGDLVNQCETPLITPRRLSNHMTTNMGRMGNEVGQGGNNPSHQVRDDEVSLSTSLVHGETSHFNAFPQSSRQVDVGDSSHHTRTIVALGKGK
jgi:hypothetical protein